jgi:hypothetical protein
MAVAGDGLGSPVACLRRLACRQVSMSSSSGMEAGSAGDLPQQQAIPAHSSLTEPTHFT